MCGINGFTWDDKGLAERMNSATRHRGPDGTAVWGDGSITFGHNLLAITETPANSGQPMVSSDGRYAMVYNGEIYNYRALRSELAGAGDRFTTDADTEVLFKGLIRYGKDFFDRLDGMFAIGFYDRDAGTLLLARDPSGMKPLYWTVTSDGLVFSSELRGIMEHRLQRNLDSKSANAFFILGYVPGPQTLVRGVSKLCPGQYIRYAVEPGTLESGWFGRRGIADGAFGDDEIRTTIGTAVRGHTMGLRPFGLYLSGGLDSTIVLHELTRAIPEKVRTYTTRFDIPRGGYDFNEDADVARRLCSDYRIDHHELLISDADFTDATESVITAMEEPRGNFSVAAYWLLAEMASKDVTVILSGAGGDELFMGYPHHRRSRRIDERLSRWPWWLVDASVTARAVQRRRLRLGHFLRVEKPLDRWLLLTNISPRLDPHIFRLRAPFDLADLRLFLRAPGNPIVREPLADIQNAVAELDRTFWLADEEFLRSDKIAMHFGMEGRFPLLADTVVRMANSIPSSEKLHGGTGKFLLRRAYQELLPEYIIKKPKTGWKAPAVPWMDGKFGELVRSSLSDGFYDGVKSVLNVSALRPEKGATQTVNSVRRLMLATSFQIWAKQFRITG